MVDNAGGGRYPSNYEGKSPQEIEALRARVIELAKILATCTAGRLRIYYNDEDVQRRFHEWFDGKGYESPFGRPMQTHNRLHDFHFHVTIAEDQELLPAAPRAGGGAHRADPARAAPEPAPGLRGRRILRRRPRLRRRHPSEPGACAGAGSGVGVTPVERDGARASRGGRARGGAVSTAAPAARQRLRPTSEATVSYSFPASSGSTTA